MTKPRGCTGQRRRGGSATARSNTLCVALRRRGDRTVRASSLLIRPDRLEKWTCTANNYAMMTLTKAIHEVRAGEGAGPEGLWLSGLAYPPAPFQRLPQTIHQWGGGRPSQPLRRAQRVDRNPVDFAGTRSSMQRLASKAAQVGEVARDVVYRCFHTGPDVR